MPGIKHVAAVAQVVAGLALNAFPAIFLAVYARIAPIDAQGFLALSLSIGVYVAQLLNAFIVEGLLATPGADHRLTLPTWTALLSVASAAALIAGPSVAYPVVLMFSSIGLMSGLLITRSIGMVRGDWQREAVAATVLIAAGAGALVLAIHHNEHCVRVLAAGALVATLARYRPRSARGFSGMPPDVRKSSWVTAETAVVGAVQPAITSVVLVTMGPAASVGFRVISTVSNALEPIIAYGRFRLLAHGHHGEVLVVVGIFVAGLVGVLAGAFGGLGSLIFGPAWANVGAVALILACLWKGLMLTSTVPFAALRRAGETTIVFWVRAASTVVYLVMGVGFLLGWHSNTAIFIAFVLSESFTAVLYHVVARRSAPGYDMKLSTSLGKKNHARD
ncbi:hypothetical protein H7K45_13015 [Mycobacterium yunnanensis]|uniref:Uncharacterized protein n=1 Tax=Mycobacterium yunnanensis TaxID=368477 RepID=A0A9X2Z2C9_9MYCO|nr:hypothetical protein [Mycobacterium yunnanensis]MCV7421466.1 hypothetical protein [Mycobacterium yunnanensis]